MRVLLSGVGTRGDVPDLSILQTGAWVLADASPLSTNLNAFLEGGAAPVYLGFGSMPVPIAELTPERLASALREVSTPQIAAQARSIAGRIALEGAAVAARRLVRDLE